MTPERAVEILNGKGDTISVVKRVQANRMGAEAIERCMIAKKPEYESDDGYDIDGGIVYSTAYCSNCGYEYDLLNGDKTAHCPACGQLIDWGDME